LYLAGEFETFADGGAGQQVAPVLTQLLPKVGPKVNLKMVQYGRQTRVLSEKKSILK
jgi:hypothetical protein